jgi:GAF domain-containing protein
VETDRAVHFAKAAWQMASQPDVEHTLEQILENARKVTAAAEVGILRIESNGRIQIADTTVSAVRRADELQMECRQGPCLEAVWKSDTYRIEDTRTDPRWPIWGAAVAKLGWQSILSIRLFTPERTLGALNLYSTVTAGFDDDDVEVAEIFARHASMALAVRLNEEGLQQAISARHLIGQAQGILMERYDIDADRAFMVLRRYSQDNNIKLRSVAEHVIKNRRLPGGDARGE